MGSEEEAIVKKALENAKLVWDKANMPKAKEIADALTMKAVEYFTAKQASGSTGAVAAILSACALLTMAAEAIQARGIATGTHEPYGAFQVMFAQSLATMLAQGGNPMALAIPEQGAPITEADVAAALDEVFKLLADGNEGESTTE